MGYSTVADIMGTLCGREDRTRELRQCGPSKAVEGQARPGEARQKGSKGRMTMSNKVKVGRPAGGSGFFLLGQLVGHWSGANQ